MRSFILLLLAAFSLASAVFGLEQDDYLPLREGCEWTMDAEIILPSGEKSTATAHRTVGAQVEHDGKTYHRTRTWMEDGRTPTVSSKLTRKDATGFYSIVEGNADAKEQLEVMLPFKVGQTWQKTWGSVTVSNEVIGVESVTIGGTTYKDCIHIRSTAADGSYTEDYWEAPKVGSVKSEIVYQNGGRITLTVKEFKPGK